MFKNKKWNIEHEQFWKAELELNNEGLSNFQKTLLIDVKYLLNSNSINYSEEVAEQSDLNDHSKIVKMFTLTLNQFKDSKFWIYHDMAEYNLDHIHHIYEEWGYLKPNDLKEKFIKTAKGILKI
jgi:hypothetical protein